MAQLGLKQLDSVLTGSLQVSGSSGVTGSLDVDTNIVAGNRVTSGYGTVNYSLVVNEAGHGGGDLRVESADNAYQIFSDANQNKVGIGTNSLTSLLTVDGDVTLTHITASGDISGSTTSTGSFGRVVATTLSGDGSNISGVTAEWDGTHTGTATFTGNVTASGVVSASGGFVGDGSNITGVTAEWDGTHVGDAQITGSLNVSSSFSISDIEVDTSESVRDEVLKFNGTKWVSAAEGSTFVFSIASFSDGESTSQIAGTAGATWKAADAITFTATYNNGPPTTAAISESTASPDIGVSDWTTPFATDDNTVAITYPSPGSTRRFRLIADGESDYESSITFKNYIYYGASTQVGSYDESFIEGLSSTLSEDKTQNNLSINASGDKYVFWTYPNRLGTVPNYFIWGTSTSNQVVIATSVIGSAYSVTNSAGLTENYKIYRSDVTVDESGRLDTGVTLINYIYWGASGDSSGWDSDDIKALAFKTDSNDQTQVWTEITGMTSDYILLCIPSRLTDPSSFWDNSTGFGADFESSVTVSVINQYGYTENYDVFRSTNTVTGDFTLETK